MRKLAHAVGFADGGQRVEVGDEVQPVALVLQLDELADRAEVVADVQLARWLYATENSHFGFRWLVVSESPGADKPHRRQSATGGRDSEDKTETPAAASLSGNPE